MARTGCRGYTLTELAVAAALLGLLVAVSLPGYRNHILRAHRIEAVDALLAAAAEQERFRLSNGSYADALDDGSESAEPVLPIAPLTRSQRYVLGVESADAEGYTLAARPRRGGPQADDRSCAVFRLDEAGRRSARDAAGRDATAACWR